MRPILFRIGGGVVYSYGFFIALGFLAGFFLFLWETRRRGLKVGTGIDLGFHGFVFALLGAKIGYLLTHFERLGADLSRMWILLQEGWSGTSALLGMLVGGIFYCGKEKLDIRRWADAAAPSLALGEAIGRVGCLMAGCCYGAPTELPWGIVFTESTVAPLHCALHPTQLYLIVSNTAIFLFLFLRRAKFQGESILSYVFLYTAAHAVVEIFRGDIHYRLWEVLSIGQILGMVAVVAAVALYVKMGVPRDHR